MEPINPQPTERIITSKNNSITIGIVSILVIATVGVYFWLNSSKNDGSNPPFLHIPKSTSQGLINGDIICQLPGVYSFSDAEVDTYSTNDDTTNWHPLSAGIHLYHSNEDITVSKILKSIKPTKSNKVLIAYYPSNNNGEQKFNLYPTDIGGQKKFTDPDNYKIPANEGFVIFSCQDTKIHKVLDERSDGSSLPANVTKADSGTHWILISGWKDGVKETTLKSAISNYDLKSAWAQISPGFAPSDFQQLDLNSINVSGDYRMIWLEIAANPIKKTTENAQSTCDKSCNNTCQGFASGTYACSKHTWASGFFLGVSGVTGYSCMPNASGIGCQIGLPAGISFPDYCNGSGSSFNQQACTGAGGSPYGGSDIGSVSDQPAGANKSLGAASPKITVETSLSKSISNTVDFNYTITGPADKYTSIVWTWGDGSNETKTTGKLATGSVSSGKATHQYNTNQNFYNYTAEIKNTKLPDTITQAQASGTVNIASEVKTKQTITYINPEVGNYFTSSDETEVVLKYRVDGDYLKPFDKVIWDFGDGEKKELWGSNTLFVNSDELIGHSYAKPGTYYYSLTLQKADGSEIAKKSNNFTLKDADFDALPQQTITSCTKEPNSKNNKYNVSWSKTEGSIIDHYEIKSK